MNKPHLPSDRRVVRRYSAEGRKQLIDAFNTSGLTAKAFCERQRIHPTTFSGWMRKARSCPEGFTEVNLPIDTSAPIEVDLANGVQIRVRTTGNISRTADLIRAVIAPRTGGV